jgi:hypothetical protein
VIVPPKENPARTRRNITNRWTRAAIAFFSSVLFESTLTISAPPRQLNRYAASLGDNMDVNDMRKTSTYLFLLLVLATFIYGAPATSGSKYSGGKTCPVHHLELKKERLKIMYGMMNDTCPDRLNAAPKYFPYANSVVYGGCVIKAKSPEYKDVLYCEKCRAVRKNWPCPEKYIYRLE